MPFIRELQVKYVKRRMPERSLPADPVSTPEAAAVFFIHMLGREPVERLVALFLDTLLTGVSPRIFTERGRTTITTEMQRS